MFATKHDFRAEHVDTDVVLLFAKIVPLASQSQLQRRHCLFFTAIVIVTMVKGICDTDPGRGTSRVVSQSRMVEPNHGRDSTGARGGASFENRSAGVPIPAACRDVEIRTICVFHHF